MLICEKLSQIMSNKGSLLLFLLLPFWECAEAVERPNPTAEFRVKNSDLVVVVNAVEVLPHEGIEFDKFFRIKARVAGVLKGKAEIDDFVEVVIDNTISELRNDCCTQQGSYVLFLKKFDGNKYSLVGSPLGAIPLNLAAPPRLQEQPAIPHQPPHS